MTIGDILRKQSRFMGRSFPDVRGLNPYRNPMRAMTLGSRSQQKDQRGGWPFFKADETGG